MKRLLSSLTTLAFAVAAATPALAATEVNLSCMQQAIATRESTLVSAFASYASTVQSAYQIRQSALQSAWAIQDKDQRQSSIKNAWSSFKSTTKSAKTTIRTQRKNAWKNFRDTRKTCGGSSNTDPGGGEGSDTSI